MWLSYLTTWPSSKINNSNGALSKLISDEDFSKSLEMTLINLQNSSDEFAKFAVNMNNGKGALSKLMIDEKFGKTLDSTMMNIQNGTKGLNETIDAAKSSILLKGYFKKKAKEDLKIETEKQKLRDAKYDTKNKIKTPKDSLK
jgi:phospholipid/cholesterol/gamma-HCH transport system substrate-binding protein